jgi:hypothetical protein
MSKEPKVVLGINSYTGKEGERCKLLPRLLDSILEKTNYDNYSVVLYDDFSPRSDLLEIYNQYKDKFPLLLYNGGTTPLVRWHRVRNALIKCMMPYKPDYYFLYDDDYEIIHENWMTHIVGCMENIPEVGILGAHWARLADGKTRQKQHTPVGLINNGSGYVVHTNKYVTGGCWTVRPEVIKQIGIWPEIKYDDGEPGADTWYGWEMMEKTDYKLCTTLSDMVMHTGQEFMVGRYEHKYKSKEFQGGKRLY